LAESNANKVGIIGNNREGRAFINPVYALFYCFAKNNRLFPFQTERFFLTIREFYGIMTSLLIKYLIEEVCHNE